MFNVRVVRLNFLLVQLLIGGIVDRSCQRQEGLTLFLHSLGVILLGLFRRGLVLKHLLLTIAFAVQLRLHHIVI